MIIIDVRKIIHAMNTDDLNIVIIMNVLAKARKKKKKHVKKKKL